MKNKTVCTNIYQGAYFNSQNKLNAQQCCKDCLCEENYVKALLLMLSISFTPVIKYCSCSSGWTNALII